jgi:hypothetical protein
MRTVIVSLVLLACVVAFGAEQNSVQKIQREVFELKLDLAKDSLASNWLDRLVLAESYLYLGEFQATLDAYRIATVTLYATDPGRVAMKKGMLGQIANTGRLGDAPSDDVYLPPEGSEQQAATQDPKQKAREDAKKAQDRANMLKTVANTDQLGDVDDSAYMAAPETGSSNAKIAPISQATEDAKKKNARDNMMGGTVINGGYNDNGDIGDYQTDIQPVRKGGATAGEDRVPYLIKQTPSTQNPNKNAATDIQRDMRRQMMKQQVIQTNPYDDL